MLIKVVNYNVKKQTLKKKKKKEITGVNSYGIWN